jgi:hypothetical protein
MERGADTMTIRRWMALGFLVAIAAALVLAVAAYEVLSLGASLTRIVRDGRAGGLASLRPRVTSPAVPEAPGAPRHEAPPTSVSFTVTEDDVSRMLRREDRLVGDVVVVDRDVVAHLVDGHVALETRNRVRLAGLLVASYGGLSDWSLTPRPRGLGLRLNELRLAGAPVPGAGWLIGRFGPRDGDWVVVPTGPRHQVERVDVADRRLSVSARVGGRV